MCQFQMFPLTFYLLPLNNHVLAVNEAIRKSDSVHIHMYLTGSLILPGMFPVYTTPVIHSHKVMTG